MFMNSLVFYCTVFSKIIVYLNRILKDGIKVLGKTKKS